MEEQKQFYMEDVVTDEILKMTQKLDKLEAGSKEHEAYTKDIKAMLDALADRAKEDREYEKMTRELKLKTDQLEQEKALKERELDLKESQLEHDDAELKIKEKELELKEMQIANENANKKKENLLKERELQEREAEHEARVREDRIFKALEIGVALVGMGVEIGLSLSAQHMFRQNFEDGLMFENEGIMSSIMARENRGSFSQWLKNRVS